MSNPTGNPKKSFFDLSQYSDRTRKIVFGIVIGALLTVVIVAMFIISPLAEKNNVAPEPASTATQAPIIPDATTGPTANPLTAEEQAQNAQDQIIENGLNNPEQDEEIIDIEPDIPNVDALTTIATNGVLSYCVIAAGETTEQRKTKMAPFFHPDSSTLNSPAELYYERVCSVEAVTEPEIATNGDVMMHFGVAWSAVLSASDEAAEAGYTQYMVTVDENGIISLND